MRKAKVQVILALDVGGTWIKAGIVTPEGRLLHTFRRSMETRAGAEGVGSCVLESLAALLRVCARRRLEPCGLAMGFPGTVAGSEGRVLTAPPQIPGIRGMALVPLMQEAAHLPALAVNDADAAAFGESRVGAGRGRDPLLMVTVGTGIGGGLVLDGRLRSGPFGTGGEIGQTVFRPDRFPSPFGGRCRLEYHAASGALLRAWRRAGGSRTADVGQVLAAARAGEEPGLRAFAEVGRALGIGVANAALLVPPSVVVVGGGLSAAGRLLLDPLREAFREAALPYTVKGCRILKARLGNKAGMLGAALLLAETSELQT